MNDKNKPINMEILFNSILTCKCGEKFTIKKIMTTKNEFCFFTACDNKECVLHKKGNGLKINISISEYNLKENNIK